uniref:protein-serine/threonine phosphatase n=1 Tax=Panagrellus redivivus TaxID=6233 RepID=A0A7E4ZZC8_PANRE
MGQTLGEPVKTKETASCGNSLYKVGSSCMQGWRINMEDAHTHLLALPDDNKAAFFAVYDGHGGARVSEYAGIHLHKRIVNNQFYKEGRIPEAIQHGFMELDELMLQDDNIKEEMSGATAIMVLVKNNIVYCGNVGDSRAVSCNQGIAMPLSFDHKPCNELEQRRITAAGGFVEFNRVNGNLALSRALGDFAFKRNRTKLPKDQIVTAYPDISCFELTKDFEFIVVACDGIWDVMTNEEVVKFCRQRLQKGMEPELICEELLDTCLSPDCELNSLGCDNMTVILILCLQGDDAETYLARVQRPKPTGKVENPIRMCEEVVPTACDDTFATPSQSPSTIEEDSDDEKPPMVFSVDEEVILPVTEVVIEAEPKKEEDATVEENTQDESKESETAK